MRSSGAKVFSSVDEASYWEVHEPEGPNWHLGQMDVQGYGNMYVSKSIITLYDLYHGYWVISVAATDLHLLHVIKIIIILYHLYYAYKVTSAAANDLHLLINQHPTKLLELLIKS